MKYSGHRKLLCEFLKLSKLNAFILIGYQTNTDASILVYKFRPERTGFNMYADYTQPQLTFLALNPWGRGVQEGGRGSLLILVKKAEVDLTEEMINFS